MTNEEKIDEMVRQLNTTKPTSRQKIRDLERGIRRAERKRRKAKLEAEGCIIIGGYMPKYGERHPKVLPKGESEVHKE